MSIHQERDFDASPARVYGALLEEFSGGAEAGVAFSAFYGQITGRQIELVRDRRIVQAWRSGGWDEGVYSVVRFELEGDGERTHVVLDHAGYPQGHREHLDAGWDAHYWEPLASRFASG